MRISDWRSDVCSSDLALQAPVQQPGHVAAGGVRLQVVELCRRDAEAVERARIAAQRAYQPGLEDRRQLFVEYPALVREGLRLEHPARVDLLPTRQQTQHGHTKTDQAVSVQFGGVYDELQTTHMHLCPVSPPLPTPHVGPQ